MWFTFIGFMGCGKSTAAASLATRMGRPCVDLDTVVAQQTGLSIPEIFQSHGESGFRALEMEALGTLPPGADLILAPGGGIVETPPAVELLRSRGHVIWLDLAWNAVWGRLAASVAERPLVAALGESGLSALFAQRRVLYQAAAHQLLRSDLANVEQIVDASVEIIGTQAPEE